MVQLYHSDAWKAMEFQWPPLQSFFLLAGSLFIDGKKTVWSCDD